jgi:hypothetical protein
MMAGQRQDQSKVIRLVSDRPALGADAHQAEPAAKGLTSGTVPAPEAVEGDLDRQIHAFVTWFTGGLSPISLAGGWLDWIAHLALSPGRQMELAGLVCTPERQVTSRIVPGRHLSLFMGQRTLKREWPAIAGFLSGHDIGSPANLSAPSRSQSAR